MTSKAPPETPEEPAMKRSMVRSGTVEGRNFFPSTSEGSARSTRPTRGGRGIPWKTHVELDDILYMVRRDELAAKTIDKWVSAAFNKWLEVRSDDERLKTAIEDMFERLNFKAVLAKAYMQSKVMGVSLIGLGYLEASESPDMSRPPDGVPARPEGIDFVNAIPRTSIQKFNIDLNPMSKTYGEILSYVLNIPTEAGDRKETFNAERCIHWPNEWLDSDPEGISMFEPLFDKLVLKKNLDLAMGEVPRQQAKSIPVIYGPQDTDEDSIDAAEETIKNIDIRSYLMLPDTFKFELVGTAAALDPSPYTDYLLTTLAAGSTGSKVALLGTEAGAVTGSEVNMQEWYSAVADEQSTFIEPVIRKFIGIMQERGILPSGVYWLDWNPLYELDGKENAEIEDLRASALQKTAVAISLMSSQGFGMTVEEDQLVFTKEGTTLKVPAPGLNAMGFMSSPVASDITDAGDGTTHPKTNQFATGLPTVELDRLFDAWVINTQDIENRFYNDMQTSVTEINDEFLKFFAEAWEADIGSITADPSKKVTMEPPIVGKNDEADMIAALENWNASSASFRDLEVLIQSWLKEAYSEGAIETLDKLGVSTDVFRLEDTEAVRVLEQQGTKLAKDTLLDGHKGAMNEIINGLKSGESYAQINNRVATVFGERSKGFPATVQKLVHEAASQARWDTMLSRGIDKGVYTTAKDERVRDTHAAMDGQIVTEDQAMGLLSEFGCRCTIIPLTAYDQAVAEYQAEQEGA